MNVQLIPANHFGYQPARFDEHQFVRCARAVSRETGISFADYQGMHMHRRKAVQERRLPTPAWANTNEQLRSVLLRYLEARFFLHDKSGTDAERLARVDAAAKGDIPRLQRDLERLLIQYHAAAKFGGRDIEKLAVEVQNVDTQIVLYRRGFPAVVAAVVYDYYRRGHNSVQVAEAHGLKPPHVRVVLHRLAAVAGGKTTHGKTRAKRGRKLEVANKPKKRGGPRGPATKWTVERMILIKRMREAGKSWKECAMAASLRSPITASHQFKRHQSLLAQKSRSGSLPSRSVRSTSGNTPTQEQE